MRTLRFVCFLVGLGSALGLALGAGWLVWTIAHAVTWPQIKSAFYTVIFMAIFFYTACAIRAVAKYFEAKTNRIKEDE